LLFSFFLTCNYKFLTTIDVIPNAIYSKTTPYQYIAVVDSYHRNQAATVLYSTKSILQSTRKKFSVPDDFLDGHYNNIFYEFFKQKQKRDDILVLGNAAGIFLTGMLHNMNQNGINSNIDVVEIDEALTEVAHKYFFMPEDSRVKFHYKDARLFLNQSRKTQKYDLIFFDMYTNNYLIPYHLITQETMSILKKLLNEDGILLINVIGGKDGAHQQWLNQMYSQVTDSFLDTKVYRFPTQDRFFNTVIAGYNTPYSNETNLIKSKLQGLEYSNIKKTDKIFTDNYAPVEKFVELR